MYMKRLSGIAIAMLLLTGTQSLMAQSNLTSDAWMEFKAYMKSYDSIQTVFKQLVESDPELEKNPSLIQTKLSAEDQKRINEIYQGVGTSAMTAIEEIDDMEGLTFEDLRYVKTAGIGARKVDKALKANLAMIPLVEDADSVKALKFDTAKMYAYLGKHDQAAATAVPDVTEDLPHEELGSFYASMARGYAQKEQVAKAQRYALDALKELTTYVEEQKALLKGTPDEENEVGLVDRYAIGQYLELVFQVASAMEEENRKDFYTKAQETIDDEKTWQQLVPALDQRLKEAAKEEEALNKPAPEWPEHDWIGTEESLSLEKLKGKVVLIDFFATWCRPCIVAFPYIRNWQKEYEDDGLVVVGLTNYQGSYKKDKVTPPDEFERMMNDFIPEHEVTWPVGIESNGRQAFLDYGVRGIPHLVLVGREGKIRYVKTGAGQFEQTESKIKELLAE